MPPRSAKGKENVPVKRVVEDAFDGDQDVDTPQPSPPKKSRKQRGRPPKIKEVEVVAERGSAAPEAETEPTPPPASVGGSSSDLQRLQRLLTAVTAERDRARSERDEMAKQFDELASLRNTAAEDLLLQFKSETAQASKAQASLIANADGLNEKLKTKLLRLDKMLTETAEAKTQAEEKAAAAAAPPMLDGKLDGKSAQDLHDEVFKLRKNLQAKDNELKTLQREYEQEVAQSRKLQKERRPSMQAGAPSAAGPSSSAVAAATAEETDKDQTSISMYEDLSGLAFLNVAIKRNEGRKEVQYSCMQTVENRSLAFKLRTYAEFNRDKKRWFKYLEYTPDESALRNENDEAFVNRLGPFTEGFTVLQEQGQSLWENLRARMSPTGSFVEPTGGQ